MKLPLAFTRIAFQKNLVYQLDFWANIFSVFIMMYAGYSIWQILYREQPNAFGVTLEQMTTYGVLGMFLPTILMVGAETQQYIALQVRMGTLELDILKPVHFLLILFYRNIGEFLVQLLIRGIPCLLFAVFVLDFPLPQNPWTLFRFVISLFLAYVISFEINLLIGLVAIVTLDVRSYTWAINSLIHFASGQLVPLWMFPTILATVLTFLPFQGMYFSPIAVYIEAQPMQSNQLILVQILWVICLFIIANFFWVYLHRRMTVQGG